MEVWVSYREEHSDVTRYTNGVISTNALGKSFDLTPDNLEITVRLSRYKNFLEHAYMSKYKNVTDEYATKLTRLWSSSCEAHKRDDIKEVRRLNRESWEYYYKECAKLK